MAQTTNLNKVSSSSLSNGEFLYLALPNDPNRRPPTFSYFTQDTQTKVIMKELHYTTGKETKGIL